jgi:hypothetical protein
VIETCRLASKPQLLAQNRLFFMPANSGQHTRGIIKVFAGFEKLEIKD